MTGMRTQAADGITKPKVDPLNSEAPRVRPQESITKHNNHSEGAKISCRANGKANKSAVNMGNPVGPEKTRTAKVSPTKSSTTVQGLPTFRNYAPPEQVSEF